MAGNRTIGDIARLAGVSKATVSRVLNNKPDVDPLTRQRILRIVEEERFVPSITASNLARGRSRLIGIIIPSFTWPFIPDIMRGVAEVIAMIPYELVLYSVNDTIREANKRDVIDHILATKMSAGLLAVFPGQSSLSDLMRLRKSGLPLVVIDDQEAIPGAAWVGVDNRRGAYTAVHHLITLGHRRIAHIQGPRRYLVSQDRHHGYIQALEDAGLVVDPELVQEGDFTQAGGIQAARKLFALAPEKRPTAIFAASDLTAYGVLAAAEEYNLAIPRDLALIGFDDISSAAHMRPALSTIRQPFSEMGQRSIELLLSMLDKSQEAIGNQQVRMQGQEDVHSDGSMVNVDVWSSRIQLPTHLIVRASCGAAHPLTMPAGANEEYRSDRG